MKTRTALIIALAALFILVILANLQIFEDGSLLLGPIKACLPYAICNL